MVLLYYIPIFFCLVSCVSADNWDDFANNLATDLAPLITLFGEQITRQCMSELIGTLDDFIFALAPLGVLTAVVSAIRVCGNSTLRAIIGRAKEDPASSEKEILSCVSSSTGEIFTESGVARITGNPKILEIVVDESQAQSGVVTVRTVSDIAGKSWADLEKDVKSPNLSLNKGIRRRAPYWFHLAATFGVILQLCIILYAALTVMYKPQNFLKDGSPVDSYAFPMYVLGTVLLTLGMFLCAVLVERHSLKQDITLPKGNRAYWIQPGNQTAGDQKFPSFVGRTDEGVYFIRSVRYDSPNSLLNLGGEMELMLVVGLTMIGFVIQFVGIRGLHSSVILAQLGATMVMTLVRTGLRAGRMQEGDNMLKGGEQTIVSKGEHELDWLIFHLFKIKSFKICPSYRVHGPSPQSQVDPIIREPVLTRKRLRKLAGSDWDETPVRRMAQNLGQATHDLMRVIGSWCDREVPYFDIDIPLGIQKEGAQQLLSHTWQTRLTAGKEVDVDFLEAILGLYVWSLKEANHGLVEKSKTEFFRTFNPREFTSHQAQLLYQAWANDISSFIDTQSASRYYLSECWTFGHLDMMTNNKVQNDTALIAISSDIYTLAAQDIYMHILHSALEPLSAIGGKIQIKGSDKSSYRLSNEHVELLASGFSMAGLGDFNQSLASILPVLADRSLISGVSSGLLDVRQSMEGFATNEDFGSLIEMSEWLCSLADQGEVQRSIVEYAHLCLNILLKPDIVVQELAVERIAAMLDVADGGRLSHSISKYLKISSSPTEEWLNRFRAEIAWMVSQIIHSLKTQSWDKRMLKLLQKLETKVGEHAFTLPETYHNLEAAASSQRTFFALWLGSNIGFPDSSNHSSQDALDWLMNNQFTILLELLVIKMVNDFSLTYHLLELIIYAAQKDYREAIYYLLHHTERTKRRHDIISRLSRQGDIETLKAFLGKGGIFGTITESHELSFLIAAEEKHYPLLKFLLEGGVNVDLRDSNGETALMKAASNGDIDSTELLISFNASLDQQKYSGDTALICAVDNGHLHLVELLISKGADVNLRGYRGKTALMSAALGRDMQILKYLCEHNADVDIRDLDKNNVLDVAEKGGFEPWVEGCAYLEELGAKRSIGVQNPD